MGKDNGDAHGGNPGVDEAQNKTHQKNSRSLGFNIKSLFSKGKQKLLAGKSVTAAATGAYGGVG